MTAGRGSRRQAGLTLLSGLFLAILIGFAVLFLFRAAPMYLQYYELRKALESMRSEINSYDSVDTADIEQKLERRFDIDYIDVVKPRDLHISKDEGRILAHINYRDKRPLFGNLSLVGHFDRVIQLYP